jgi:hypothetical protein
VIPELCDRPFDGERFIHGLGKVVTHLRLHCVAPTGYLSRYLFVSANLNVEQDSILVRESQNRISDETVEVGATQNWKVFC